MKPTTVTPAPRMCRLGYIAAAEEADRRMKAREHQHQCRRCMKWYWPSFEPRDGHEEQFGHKPEPAGFEVNHFGNLVRARRWKRPCVDCDAAQADWNATIAESDRIVAHAKAGLLSTSKGQS